MYEDNKNCTGRLSISVIMFAFILTSIKPGIDSKLLFLCTFINRE